jgi:hypothetical protein
MTYNRKTAALFLALQMAGLSLVGYANGFKFAVVNDIHADLTYVPTSATCISKTLPPVNPALMAEGETIDYISKRPETYVALKA